MLPAIMPIRAHATQLANRSITLSDSGPSASTITGIGSGTGVTYRVSIDLSNNADSMVIDFCAGTSTPLINDTCAVPTGMHVTAAALTNGVGGTTTISAWTLTPTDNGTNQQLKIAKGSGATASGNSTTPVRHTFSVTGITNPSTLGTFYARIYTYTNGTFGTYASPTSTGNYVDYGGIALTTNNIISITARVQESLSFCVSGRNQVGAGTGPQVGWTTTNNCSDPNASVAPALTLGHGTPTPILDSGNVDYGTVFSQISTNASNGAVIAMRNSNSTCTNDGGATFPSGLSADAGATCAIPGSGSTAVSIVAGVAKFGMFAWDTQPAGASSVGSITPTATYHDNAHKAFTVNGVASNNFNAVTTAADPIVPTDVFYGMDYTTAVGTDVAAQHTQFGNVRTTFGSIVGSCTGPVFRVNGAYTFAATASLTTPAGVYTANLDLIATGTF